MGDKYCKHCAISHPLTSEFWYFGQSIVCKTKELARCRSYRARNPEKRKEIVAASQAKNPETKKRYYRENRDRLKANMAKNYRIPENMEKAKLRAKLWEQENRDRKNKRCRERHKRLIESGDVQYRLANRLRIRLYQAVRGNFKAGSAVELLGCSISELKMHLESLWKPGMSWENWSFSGWHIDHIRPLSSFDLSNEEQIRLACHYTNLQPLWARDNLVKSDRVQYESA